MSDYSIPPLILLISGCAIVSHLYLVRPPLASSSPSAATFTTDPVFAGSKLIAPVADESNNVLQLAVSGEHAPLDAPLSIPAPAPDTHKPPPLTPTTGKTSLPPHPDFPTRPSHKPGLVTRPSPGAEALKTNARRVSANLPLLASEAASTSRSGVSPKNPVHPETTDNHYLIQLVGSPDLADIKRFRRLLNHSLNTVEDVKELMVSRGGKTWYLVLMGPYEGYSSAKRQLTQLPASIRKYAPWLRKAASVENELQATQDPPT